MLHITSWSQCGAQLVIELIAISEIYRYGPFISLVNTQELLTIKFFLSLLLLLILLICHSERLIIDEDILCWLNICMLYEFGKLLHSDGLWADNEFEILCRFQSLKQ